MLYFNIIDHNFGYVLISISPHGINCLLIGENREDLLKEYDLLFPKHTKTEDVIKLDFYNQILSNYINNKPIINISQYLDISGTSFQQTVWNELLKIPYGQTISYKELASKIGNDKAVRALAKACASNKIALLIPCHRVIGSDGNLKGYRWNIKTKEYLLSQEKSLLVKSKANTIAQIKMDK